jgi:hypothetical protein
VGSAASESANFRDPSGNTGNFRLDAIPAGCGQAGFGQDSNQPREFGGQAQQSKFRLETLCRAAALRVFTCLERNRAPAPLYNGLSPARTTREATQVVVDI